MDAGSGGYAGFSGRNAAASGAASVTICPFGGLTPFRGIVGSGIRLCFCRIIRRGFGNVTELCLQQSVLVFVPGVCREGIPVSKRT